MWIATEDLIDGGVRWQSAVEDGEVSLESLRDVVPPAAGVNHGRQDLDVNNIGEVSRFVQIVHAFHFHHLTHYFVGDLRNTEVTRTSDKKRVRNKNVKTPDLPIR